MDGNQLLDANVVLQVHKSHLSRVEDYIADTFKHRDDNIKIVASKKSTVSKTCSLLFLYVSDLGAFSDRFMKSTFVFQGLNKSYVLSSNRKLRSGSIDNSIGNELCHILQKEQEDNADKSRMVVKVDTFPPRIQQEILVGLNESLEKENIPQEEIDIAPTNHTHTLSIIQIAKKESNKSASFLIGISPVQYSIPSLQKTNDIANGDVCRAYHKLAEAFERYKAHYNSNGWPFHDTAAGSKRKIKSPIIGIDCGAAPGGWTKYLIEQTVCDEVYSIDPGKLSGYVLSLSNVTHLQMTGEEAIPKICEFLRDRDTLVSIWVSDMCVHEVSKQVDMLLTAKSKELFKPDAAFVLTIKCNVGHAKERFNEMTTKELDRLKKACAYDVLVLHLFSNRIGERTIIGFIK